MAMVPNAGSRVKRRASSTAGGRPLVLGAVAVALVSAIAGGIALGRKPLWMDEAIDVQWTHTGWHGYLSIAFRGEMGQALWLLLLKPWLAFAGHSEIAARIPSVLFAAAACALLVPVGRDLLGNTAAGVAAGLLTACNAFVVSWEQQARTYTLSLFASVAATFLFLRAVRSDAWRRWIVYGLAAGVAVYAHFFVGLVILAHGVAALTRRPHPGRPAVYAAAIIVGLSLPAVAFAIDGPKGQAWIPPLTTDVAASTVHALLGGRWLLVAAAVAGAAVAIVRLERWRSTLLVSWLILPIATAAAASAWRPLFLDRYMIATVPAASLLIAYLVTQARGRVAVISVAVACVWSLGPVADWYRSPPIEDWRSAGAYIDSHRTHDEHLYVASDWLALVAAYYMKSEPDSHELQGQTTWVMAAASRAGAARTTIARSGYRIAHQTTFPGVYIAKAVRHEE